MVLGTALAGLRDQTQSDMVARFTAAAAPVEANLARVFSAEAPVDHDRVDRCAG